MKIGELAKKSGLSAHTLRFYEKQGLIKASGRSESNYRIYNSDDLGTARFVKRSGDMGFSLDEVDTFLSIRADKPAHMCADAKDITELKITEVEQKITEFVNKGGSVLLTSHQTITLAESPRILEIKRLEDALC